MSDFDDLIGEVQANSRPKHKSCGVSALLQSLPGDDAEKVETVLSDRRLTTAAIFEALRKRIDDPPSVFTIGRHRRKMCGCFNNTRGAELK